MFNRHIRSSMRQTIRQQLSEKTPDVLYLDHLACWLFGDSFRRTFQSFRTFTKVYLILAKRVAFERKFPVKLYLHNEARLLGYMEKQVAAS